MDGFSLREAWLDAGEADRVLRALLGEIPWEAREIRMFGKSVPQPRLMCWMGDSDAVYTYSGLRNVPVPWSPLVAELRARVERAAGAAFNSVLLNLYRDGADSMGLHADDEPELGDDPVIASVSFGATRKFVLKPRRKKGTTPSHTLLLSHGSLLVMSGAAQRDWVHGVPKERGVTSPRVNLTFRRIVAR